MLLSQVSMIDDDRSVGGGRHRASLDVDFDEDIADHHQDDILTKLHPRAREILKGATDNLPAMPSNVIRIFLSSTFSG